MRCSAAINSSRSGCTGAPPSYRRKRRCCNRLARRVRESVRRRVRIVAGTEGATAGGGREDPRLAASSPSRSTAADDAGADAGGSEEGGKEGTSHSHSHSNSRSRSRLLPLASSRRARRRGLTSILCRQKKRGVTLQVFPQKCLSLCAPTRTTPFLDTSDPVPEPSLSADRSECVRGRGVEGRGDTTTSRAQSRL